jgi:hypothetical protein
MATRNYGRAGTTYVNPIACKGGPKYSPGEIIMIGADGYAKQGVAEDGDLPGGVCERYLDTTGASDGQFSLSVEYGGDYVEVDNSTGADAVLITDYNAPVYTLDVNSVSRLSSGKSKLGIFKGFNASGRVRVQVLPN